MCVTKLQREWETEEKGPRIFRLTETEFIFLHSEFGVVVETKWMRRYLKYCLTVTPGYHLHSSTNRSHIFNAALGKMYICVNDSDIVDCK